MVDQVIFVLSIMPLELLLLILLMVNGNYLLKQGEREALVELAVQVVLGE
jgi:hypothetical protein